MDNFVEALLADKCNTDYIPKEDDWFEGLIGDWNFIWKGSDGREVEGEWFFRKVLEGCAIEDIFIAPSRKTREINPQPDGEYGAALRVYNREKRCYDMTYVCQRYTVHLVVHKKDGIMYASMQQQTIAVAITAALIFISETISRFVCLNNAPFCLILPYSRTKFN